MITRYGKEKTDIIEETKVIENAGDVRDPAIDVRDPDPGIVQDLGIGGIAIEIAEGIGHPEEIGTGIETEIVIVAGIVTETGTAIEIDAIEHQTVMTMRKTFRQTTQSWCAAWLSISPRLT